MVIFGYRVGPLVKKTGREVLDDGVLGLSAQAAYYFFFSLFPIFLFLAPLLALVGDKQQTFGWVMSQLQQAVPGEGFALLRDVVDDVVFTEGAPGLMSVGALLALWAGSNVFSALMDALNKAYDVEETRPYWKKKLIAMVSVIVVGGTVIAATTVILAGEHIAQWVTARLGLDSDATGFITVVQLLIAFALLVALAWLTFYFLPNLKQSGRHVLAGAFITTLLWIIVTLIFRFYVTNFASYNKTYGTIGGVIVLLTWMYLSMLVFLVGGEVNSELHKGTGAVAPRRGMLFGGRIETAETACLPSTDRVEKLDPLGVGSA